MHFISVHTIINSEKANLIFKFICTVKSLLALHRLLCNMKANENQVHNRL